LPMDGEALVNGALHQASLGAEIRPA